MRQAGRSGDEPALGRRQTRMPIARAGAQPRTLASAFLQPPRQACFKSPPSRAPHLLHQVLLDDLEDLVLLQHLAGDVEGQVLAVHHACGNGIRMVQVV